jgi:hypothetical protein
MAVQKVDQNVMNQNVMRTSALQKSPAKTAQKNLADIAKINSAKNPLNKGWFDNKGFVIDKKA